jgi:hypothetical protein
MFRQIRNFADTNPAVFILTCCMVGMIAGQMVGTLLAVGGMPSIPWFSDHHDHVISLIRVGDKACFPGNSDHGAYNAVDSFGYCYHR